MRSMMDPGMGMWNFLPALLLAACGGGAGAQGADASFPNGHGQGGMLGADAMGGGGAGGRGGAGGGGRAGSSGGAGGAGAGSGGWGGFSGGAAGSGASGGAGSSGGQAGSGGGGSSVDWYSSATEHRGQDGIRFDYDCPAGSPGSIWGTDLYTDDSSVCTAAVHVGLITADTGGRVTIEIRPGASAYTGSLRFGVESREYESWMGSYAFPAAPTPPDAGAAGAPDAGAPPDAAPPDAGAPADAIARD
jgi:hypothetical protein